MDQLQKAIEILQQGGVIVYPTETAYGLGCDARNENAVARIFEIKKRSRDKSLPVIVANLEMAREYGDLPELGEELARKYWPGPLTLVVHAQKKLPEGVLSPDGSIALRVSSHTISQKLSEGLGAPIVSTSANITSSGNKYSLQEVKDELGDVVDFYLDGGVLPVVNISTIVDVRDNTPKIIRQGAITL